MPSPTLPSVFVVVLQNEVAARDCEHRLVKLYIELSASRNIHANVNTAIVYVTFINVGAWPSRSLSLCCCKICNASVTRRVCAVAWC